jgi:hypothetical protein
MSQKLIVYRISGPTLETDIICDDPNDVVVELRRLPVDKRLSIQKEEMAETDFNSLEEIK